MTGIPLSITTCLPFPQPLFYFHSSFSFVLFFFLTSISPSSRLPYLVWTKHFGFGFCFHRVSESVKLSRDHHLLGRFLVIVLVFFVFFLAVLAPSLCSSHLASIYPHLTRTDLFLNFICMTRYFPAPRNEERGWVCLLNLPTYPSDSVGISLYFLGRIHFSYPSRPAPSISYSCTFLPLHLSIIVAGFPSTCSRHIFN